LVASFFIGGLYFLAPYIFELPLFYRMSFFSSCVLGCIFFHRMSLFLSQ
jgi:hypothetical protein